MARFVFMSYVRVVRKTLISGAPDPAKTSQSTPYDAYRAREIEENASYKGYYAISYPIAPLRVETYVFDALLGIRPVRRIDVDQVQLQKQRRETMSESTGQLTDGQDTSRETEAVEGEGHSTIG
jgi:hypothetical protein